MRTPDPDYCDHGLRLDQRCFFCGREGKTMGKQGRRWSKVAAAALTLEQALAAHFDNPDRKEDAWENL